MQFFWGRISTFHFLFSNQGDDGRIRDRRALLENFASVLNDSIAQVVSKPCRLNICVGPIET